MRNDHIILNGVYVYVTSCILAEPKLGRRSMIFIGTKEIEQFSDLGGCIK